VSTTTASPEKPKAADERPRTPEQIERDWFENVYAGDRMKQLTARALIMGMMLGMVMACSNVYVGLKSGWGMGVAITSCIMAWSIFAVLHASLPKLFPPYSILENNAMQSCASAAGAITGAGLVNAIPALLMLDPTVLPTGFAARCWILIPWLAVVAWLGVFLAVPTKRQLINIEQLRFPSGVAAATTLRSLHGAGGEAARQARALFSALGLGAIVTWMRDADAPWMRALPIKGMPDWAPFKSWVTFPSVPWLRYPRIETVWGTSWVKLGSYKDQVLGLNQVTMSFEGSLLFIAAGAIMSFRTAWSLMLGAIINYVWLAPIFLRNGDITGASFRNISRWSLWIGVPMMVTSGLLLFFMNWKSVVRAFSTIGAFFRTSGGKQADPMDRIEVPGSWFIAGYAVLGTAAIVLGNLFFHIHWWMGLIAVMATFLLVVVAARATGETDITPVGPLSKITQLTFGAIAPGNVPTNLMTANITAGATGSAGDLLTDLKSGYLLGANPRQQFFAQFFGVLAGALVVIPVFFILIPDPALLGTEKWPAPAALVWRGVAELLAKGPGALPVSARYGLVIGASLGIILTLLEVMLPRFKKFVPSPTGLGIAFTINGFNSISMFIGALLALGFSAWKPKASEHYTVPVASGIIAGESLMGVGIAVLSALHLLG
jgi:uncharacterized oligopeptide transporter (OPT) family protein